MNLDLFHHLLAQPEGEHLEFKEWKRKSDADALGRYCCALANEGGGYFVLGVTDRRPRRVVGTTVFEALEATTESVRARVRIAVEAAQLKVDGKRVVVFTVPARPRGVPILYRGASYHRQGESLLPMSDEKLRSILAEIGGDRSAEECGSSVTFASLDPGAIAGWRRRWQASSGDEALLGSPPERLLEEAGLVQGGRITLAALVLLGTDRSVTRELGSPGVIVEHRDTDGEPQATVRQETHDGGFFVHHERLWQTLHLDRGTRPSQEGPGRLDLATFDGPSVREALLNAVAHRDYSLPDAIVVRQSPRRLEVTSPGGFLPGLSPASAPGQSAPRNRRLAGALRACGLVDGAGRGLDRIDAHALTHGKPRPDFTGTDESRVSLTLDGTITRPEFLRFYRELARPDTLSLSLSDLRALAAIESQSALLPEQLLGLPRLVEAGLVRRQGRGTYVLAAGSPALTRSSRLPTPGAGLDRKAHKELLLARLQTGDAAGSPFTALRQVLPQLERSHLQGLLRELGKEGKVRLTGEARGLRWHAVG